MWGGFDLSSATKQLGALGSQLGEAIQKAKNEVENTIDSFERGDDYVAPVSWTSTVQPPPAQPDTGTAFSFLAGDTTAQVPHEHSYSPQVPAAPPAEAAEPPQLDLQAPSTAPPEAALSKPKKKIIKKIVRKVPAGAAGASAASAVTSTTSGDAGSIVQPVQADVPPPQQADIKQQQKQPAHDRHAHTTQETQQVLDLPDDNGWGVDACELDLQFGLLGPGPQTEQQQHQQQQQTHPAGQMSQQALSEGQLPRAGASDGPVVSQPAQEHLQQLEAHHQPDQHEGVHAVAPFDQPDGYMQQQQQEGWQEPSELQLDAAQKQQQQQQEAADTGQPGSGLHIGWEAEAASEQQQTELQEKQQQHASLAEEGTPSPAAAAADGVFDAVAVAASAADTNGNHAESVTEQPGQAMWQEAHVQACQQVEQQEQQQSQQQEATQVDQSVQQLQVCEGGMQDQEQQQQTAEMAMEQQAVQQLAALELHQPDAEEQQEQINSHQQHSGELEVQQQQQQRQQQQQQHSATMGNGNAAAHMSEGELQQQLAAREAQLSRAAARLSELESSVAQLSESKAELEVVVQQLSEANEHLHLRAAKVSEAELQEVQQEATDRLAAAERKVFALTKERDALKRAAAAAASPGGGGTADTAALRSQLHKKEELVSQLMDEGEKLSKRQLELEGTVKKLRQQLKASEAEREKLGALLTTHTSEADSLRRAKAKAERDLVAAVEAGRQEVEAVRQQAQADALNIQAEQAAAQAVAAQAATGELSAALKAAESRNGALTESLSELQEALERQRAAADLREEMLRQDLADVERRAQAAETRHQELSAKLPETTAPLLRQISALQDASSAQAQAWAAAERSLTSRLRDAEAGAAAAAAREAAAQEALGALQVRVAAAEASAAAAKSAATEAAMRATRAEERLAVTQAQLEEQLAAAAETQALFTQSREDLRAAEAAAARKLDAERSVRRAADEELARTRAELESLQASSAGPGGWGAAAVGQQGGPPAMAAPGFRWVLVSEADEAAVGGVGAAVVSLSRRMSSINSQVAAPGLPRHMSGFSDEDFTPGGVGGSGSRQASEAGGAFDPEDLFAAGQGGLATPTYTPRAADAASSAASQAYGGALGSPTGSLVSSRAAAASQAAQARMVAARLGGGGTVAEAAVQRLRAALRQKAGECAAMEGRLKELEATRDQLASELVKATHSAEEAADAVKSLPELQAEYRQLEQRYTAAVELLGERDEQLEEMAADLTDVKQLYKQQIEALVAQLAEVGAAQPS